MSCFARSFAFQRYTAIPKCILNPKTSMSPFPLNHLVLTLEQSWGHVNPIGPRACYDEGKRVAETLTYGFQRQDGVDVRVARIFNTYGKPYAHPLRTQTLTYHFKDPAVRTLIP
jgi:nucleoside-diphosphate-sugar epimerase